MLRSTVTSVLASLLVAPLLPATASAADPFARNGPAAYIGRSTGMEPR